MPDDHRTVTVETLAAALTDSGLIKRLTDYAIRAHPETMIRDEPNVAQSWASDIFAALPATPAIELRDDGYIVPARTPRCPIGYCTATEDCPHSATEPRGDFADPTAVDHPLYAEQATEPREDRLRAAAQRAAISDHAPMFADGAVYRACGCAVHAALRAALHPDTPEAHE